MTKSRCRDLVEDLAKASQGGVVEKRKRNLERLCKVHADGKERLAKRKKKRPNSKPEEGTLRCSRCY